MARPTTVTAAVSSVRGRGRAPRTEEATHEHHSGLRQLNDALQSLNTSPRPPVSDTSSLSSSVYSIPSYEELRRIHLVAGLPVTLALLGSFAAVAIWAWPARPHPIYFTEFLLGLVAHLASEAIRSPLARHVPPPTSFYTRSFLGLVPIFLAAYSQEAFRLFAVSISSRLDPIDTASMPSTDFFRAIWLGIGSATADSGLRAAELLRQASLYEEVLEHEGGRLEVTESEGYPEDVREEAEGVEGAETAAMVDAHVRARERLAIVESYGVGLDRIPGALHHISLRLASNANERAGLLVVLWSLNSIMLSIAMSLLLYLGFLHPTPFDALDPALWPTWVIVSTIHAILSASWVVLLPSAGLAPVSYGSLVVLVLLNVVRPLVLR